MIMKLPRPNRWLCCGISAALLTGVGAAFLDFSGWAGVYSGNYGLASHAQLIHLAQVKAQRDLWIITILGFMACVLLAAAFVRTKES